MTSPPGSILVNSGHVDLSSRIQNTIVVAASPNAAAETIIATLTLTNNPALMKGILLRGFCAVTIGTAGVSANLKIRQTNASGATVVATGACTIAAAALGSFACEGIDTAAVLPNQVYVLTLTVASANAPSPVSAASLTATLI